MSKYDDIVKTVFEERAKKANEAKLAVNESDLPDCIKEYLNELCNSEIERNWDFYINLERKK